MLPTRASNTASEIASPRGSSASCGQFSPSQSQAWPVAAAAPPAEDLLTLPPGKLLLQTSTCWCMTARSWLVAGRLRERAVWVSDSAAPAAECPGCHAVCKAQRLTHGLPAGPSLLSLSELLHHAPGRAHSPTPEPPLSHILASQPTLSPQSAAQDPQHDAALPLNPFSAGEEPWQSASFADLPVAQPGAWLGACALHDSCSSLTGTIEGCPASANPAALDACPEFGFLNFT